MTIVVVTGGTRGIGLGLVKEFASAGASVVFCGRSPERVAEVASTVEGPVVGVVADVTDREAVQALWDTAIDRFGAIDIWINNAGIAAPQLNFWELNPAEIDAVFDTNLRGYAYGCWIALNGMLKQGHGALWNMEGFGADGRAIVGMSAYGTSRAATHFLTKTLVAEAKGSGVTVHYFNAGVVATELTVNQLVPGRDEKMRWFINALGDRIDVVAPWLVSRILAGGSNGSRADWLTRRRVLWRFATAGLRKRERLV